LPFLPRTPTIPVVPTRRQVSDYVRRCANVLNVGCKVRCKYDPALPSDTWALHQTNHVDNSCFVYGDRLLAAGERMWRLTVAHELVHAHLRHFRAPLEAAGRRLGPGFLDWYDDTEEAAAERLETVLARLLPRPPWF
jgi:hypothetical protein